MRRSLILLDALGADASAVGQPVRAAGWYGPNNGLHSVSIRVLNFRGRVCVQASLAVTPGDLDWVSVLPDGADYLEYPQGGFNDAETSMVGFNFLLNALWVRAGVDRSYLPSPTGSVSDYGIVDSILLNY
jgi:hypothetical protein